MSLSKLEYLKNIIQAQFLLFTDDFVTNML